jgi:hypothetical protein
MARVAPGGNAIITITLPDPVQVIRANIIDLRVESNREYFDMGSGERVPGMIKNTAYFTIVIGGQDNAVWNTISERLVRANIKGEVLDVDVTLEDGSIFRGKARIDDISPGMAVEDYRLDIALEYVDKITMISPEAAKKETPPLSLSVRMVGGGMRDMVLTNYPARYVDVWGTRNQGGIKVELSQGLTGKDVDNLRALSFNKYRVEVGLRIPLKGMAEGRGHINRVDLSRNTVEVYFRIQEENDLLARMLEALPRKLKPFDVNIEVEERAENLTKEQYEYIQERASKRMVSEPNPEPTPEPEPIKPKPFIRGNHRRKI